MNGPPESNTPQSSAAPEQAARPSAKPPGRWRRRLLITAGVLALVAALGAAFIEFAPRYIARYVADNYLKGMQIDVEGVKTINIDLFNGEFSIGPVKFHSGTADPGTIGLLGVKLSLSNLIHRQALLQSVVLRDVDISIHQTPDGEIVINGISLRQMMAEQAEEQAKQQEQQKQDAEAKPAEPGKRWDAGIDDLIVRNTHVRFTNRAGGTAAVAVDRLDLRGFRTWEPDHPGTFALQGNVNDAEITLYGNARPFGEKINVFAELTVNGVDLSQIDQITGPLPVKPSAGTATVYARNAVDIDPGGHISGSTTGTMVLGNVDVADAKLGSVKLDQAATDVDVRFTLDPEGAADASGQAQLKLNQGSGTLPDGTSVVLPTLVLDLSDLSFSRAAVGDIQARTQARLQLDQPQLGGPASVRAEQVLITAPRIEAGLAADGATSVRLQAAEDGKTKPRLEVAGANVTAPVRATAQKLGVDLDDVALQLTSDGSGTATAGAGLAIDRGTLALADQGGRETMAVELDTLTVTLAKLTAALADGAVKASGTAGAGIDRLSATLAGPAGGSPQRLNADSLRLNLEPLTLTSQRSGPAIATSGALQLTGLAAALPAADGQPAVQFGSRDGELNVRDLQLRMDAADGGMQVGGTLNAALRGLAGSWGSGGGSGSVAPARAAAQPAPATRGGRGRAAARQAPPPPPSAPGDGGRLAADALTVGITPLALNSRGDALTGRLSVSTELSKLTARVPTAPGESPFDITLARLRLALGDTSVSSRGGDATLDGKLDLTLDGVTAVQPTPGGSASRPGERTSSAVDNLRLTLSPLSVKSHGDQLSVAASGTTDARSLVQELPKSPQKPAGQATIGALRANLTEIAAEVKPAGPTWRVGLDAQSDRLEVLADGGKTASLKLGTISIGDLTANSKQRASIERVVIDRLQGFFTRDYLMGSAAAPESRPKEVAQAVETAAQEGWKVRIGSFGVSGDSAIRVRDTSVEPNANFTIGLNTLQVQNIDMTDPSQHMLVRLDASINEFTQLAVGGWAAPFMGKPDFDINARLQSLELPPLSPYAAPAIGVNVESGRLSVDAAAAAASGNLNGGLEITLRDLNFSTLSAADAQRLSAAVGVPIETVVGLLQDDEGRIRLKLPISGDLSSPTFDPSDAIRQALTGALQAAVLAPFQLAFAPVALIAKAAGGGPMKFQPIPFQAGEASLDSQGADIAAALARVLKEREKLAIKVCGQSTMADFAALADGDMPPPGPQRDALLEELRPKLQALATQRTAAVRSALITDGGAKTRQVSECRSTFDPADQKPPRADVGL